MSTRAPSPGTLDQGSIRKIAVVRALQLGDLLVAVPALRALRSAFPAAEVTLIGLPWAASFAQRYSRYIDRFVTFPGWPGIVEAGFDERRTREFLEEQRAYGYHLALQLHGSGRSSNAFVQALGARLNAGYYEGARPGGFAVAAPYPGHLPEVLRSLELVKLLSATHVSASLEFPLTRADRAEAARLLAELPSGDGPVIGLHPGARSPARRWPAERFAAVGDACALRFAARIVLTGGPDEQATVEAVAERMLHRPLLLAGRTSLGCLAAVIASLDLFVSNDTGPAHLAEAVGTPSVTLFGPADPVRWAPLDPARHPVVRLPVGCNPCGFWECPIDHRCLRWIRPERVVDQIEGLLRMGAVACGA